MGQLSCGKCGIAFSVPDGWERERKEDKATWYCPNGHPRAFVTSTSDSLREELSREKQHNARLSDWLAEAQQKADVERRRAAAARGQVTRLKHRAAAGVCPCCNRTFTNLARHMAGKHPTFKAEAVDGDNIVPLRATQ